MAIILFVLRKMAICLYLVVVILLLKWFLQNDNFTNYYSKLFEINILKNPIFEMNNIFINMFHVIMKSDDFLFLNVKNVRKNTSLVPLKTQITIAKMNDPEKEQKRKEEILQQYQQVIGTTKLSFSKNKHDKKKSSPQNISFTDHSSLQNSESSKSKLQTAFVKLRTRSTKEGLSRDIHFNNITISIGGMTLIQDSRSIFLLYLLSLFVFCSWSFNWLVLS